MLHLPRNLEIKHPPENILSGRLTQLDLMLHLQLPHILLKGVLVLGLLIFDERGKLLQHQLALVKHLEVLFPVSLYLL